MTQSFLDIEIRHQRTVREKDNTATFVRFDLPFTEVGVLTGAEEAGITNRLSIISNRQVDELSTVLGSEINLASTRL